ncbi:MAG: sulfate ABC transporter permease subunit CysT [Proteobacteria bacterium]|nr:sulfate ABC transporter permease subunit CysT [Pseudomonadota bacterium]
MTQRRRGRHVLPGFAPALGLTCFALGLVVLLPLSALVLKATTLGWRELWGAVTEPRAVAALQLSLGTALAAAAANAVFGLLLAWVLIRYRFPGRALVDALVDLPFALPTAVSGLTLTTLYVPGGWLGRLLEPLGIQVAFTRLGIVVALIFIGLPFVVRTVQPVLEQLDPTVEEAALVLGATRWQVFYRVLLPAIAPAWATGFTLAFARALGEYGSIVFISGNMPLHTELTPLLIVSKLEQYDYAGAIALALALLAMSALLLLAVNLLHRWGARTEARGA